MASLSIMPGSEVVDMAVGNVVILDHNNGVAVGLKEGGSYTL